MTNSKAVNPLTVQKIWNSTRGIYDMKPCASGWILRAVGRICKINADFQIQWQVEFPNEEAAMFLPVQVSMGRVITPTKLGASKYELHALSEADGRNLWQSELNWRGMNTYGGMVALGERIFVPEEQGSMVPGAIILDASNGKQIGQLPQWPTEAFNRGIGPANPHFVQVGSWLYLSQNAAPAQRLNLTATAPILEPVLDIDCAILATDGQNLMVLGDHEGGFAILQLDPETMAIRSRMPVDDVEKSIGMTIELRVPASDTVILIGENGFAGARPSTSEIIWTYAPDTPFEQVSGGYVIGETIVFHGRKATGKQLLEVNWQTGEVLRITSSEKLFLNSAGWPLDDDRLLVNATASYVLLERKPELPKLPEAEEFFVATTATAMPQPESSAAPTFTPTDQQYSAIITAFVNAKAAQEQGRDADHERLAAEFNKLFDAFAQAHPELSIANIALTLSELGVPYDVAFGDVVRMRG